LRQLLSKAGCADYSIVSQHHLACAFHAVVVLEAEYIAALVKNTALGFVAGA
jgi:hypothetical protein